MSDHVHRRYNPLSGEWVLVSPHRGKRPWQGQEEAVSQEQRVQHDPQCYLCPSNLRIGGEKNPSYTAPYVFKNDFSALMADENVDSLITDNSTETSLLISKKERGVCKVICFSPRHDLTLPQLSVPEIEDVIRLWQAEYKELGAKDFINHVQIFENKGAVMGCSNPHPHGQIWAQESIPDEVNKEDINQKNFFDKNQKNLLQAYLQEEQESGDRTVAENSSFIALVPYWATWPFEVLVLPKQAQANILAMTDTQLTDYADIIKQVTIKYDNLFEISFPYSAGIHQSPTNGERNDHWCWHMHFYPPLLRSAQVKKFMVGYEMLAEPQRDVTPEQCAKILRDLPSKHYLD